MEICFNSNIYSEGKAEYTKTLTPKASLGSGRNRSEMANATTESKETHTHTKREKKMKIARFNFSEQRKASAILRRHEYLGHIYAKLYSQIAKKYTRINNKTLSKFLLCCQFAMAGWACAKLHRR